MVYHWNEILHHSLESISASNPPCRMNKPKIALGVERCDVGQFFIWSPAKRLKGPRKKKQVSYLWHLILARSLAEALHQPPVPFWGIYLLQRRDSIRDHNKPEIVSCPVECLFIVSRCSNNRFSWSEHIGECLAVFVNRLPGAHHLS